MDRRHGEIVEGAGLEESKINTDFVDWLKRWGSPILIGVLVLAVGYRGLTYWRQYQVRQLDSAYLELGAAVQSSNPVALAQVAEDWSGQPAIATQARLTAGDLYLLSYARDLKPGGTAGTPEDLPTPQERERYLQRAEDLYQRVADDTADDPNHVIPHLHALSGLASVHASRGEFDASTEILSRAAALADDAMLPVIAETFRERIETLRSGAEPIVFPKAADLPQPPEPADEGEFTTPEELLEQPGAEIGPPTPPEQTEPDAAPAPGAGDTPAEPSQQSSPPSSEAPDEPDPPSGGG